MVSVWFGFGLRLVSPGHASLRCGLIGYECGCVLRTRIEGEAAIKKRHILSDGPLSQIMMLCVRNISKSRLDRRGGAGWETCSPWVQSDSDFVFIGFAAELAEAVFDGGDGGAHVHVDFDGFHFGGVEFEEAQLGDDAVVGVHGYHVGLEVGYVEGLSGGVVGERYEVDDLVDVAFFVLNEALPLYLACASGYGGGLNAWLEVGEAVGSQVAFEGVVFVERAEAFHSLVDQVGGVLSESVERYFDGVIIQIYPVRLSPRWREHLEIIEADNLKGAQTMPPQPLADVTPCFNPG